MKVSKYTVLHPFDVLIINFGSSTSRARVSGRHLAVVVGHEDMRSRDHNLMVVPIFKSPSRHDNNSEIKIKRSQFRDIRYDQYLNPINIQRIERYRVERLIGHVSSDEIRRQIVESIIREVGDSDGK